MQTTKGRIQAVNQKDKGYGILVAGSWYNSFGQTDLVKDDYVMIDFNTKGKFNNIQTINKIDIPIQQSAGEQVVTSNTIHSTPATAKDDDIHYQVCLKIASEQIAAKGGTDKEDFIIDMAKRIKQKVWG